MLIAGYAQPSHAAGPLFVAAVGLIIIVVGLAFHVLAKIFTALFGFRQQAAVPNELPNARLCPRERCGHINRSGAKFCAHCGRDLGGYSPAVRSSHEFDRYG